ncbi:MULTISPECIES: formate-dependent phosphoribosylglycinamide formyltransferase [Spongiibacter]|uniref:formate-dependent phosphoribosylglycinamide formyltransferase n=1 Tax=Spongiibacter TaxID=630749 RepID=UPI000C09438C|nr:MULTISPECIES: formate-dependent phosphoribosylglycinamide formyltransferase [Spongiibacter]MAK45261.1 phosphoribosylglycinamide formyltransferase 2 [Spongiibacter sp.]MBM7421830.1 phosphoribosylglycinamide formyltransferase 2 [Spongiibacter marinus]MEE2651240.1 formate-dependent phosphoribosylglycinamide formyltransferase [Pseudomonadota bacterium]|tara:strand:- start:800 stop:1981 length:1182 start_codon:yes stop_codon:yes gene_type:complete
MVSIGTPFSSSACKVLLCGSGELGKEVAIELQRLGVEVIACDRYENAPAMQVADRSYCFSMLDGDELRRVIELEKPDYVVPEIEAIATDVLVELEREGVNVVPSARAAQLTMNREGIRRLAAETLDIATSPYRFADNYDDFCVAVEAIGFPCVIKPIMSSSGKGQSLLRSASELSKAWDYAQQGGRAGAGRVIVEGFVDFDYEITLLTVRHRDGCSFCAPIGHRQEAGDYRESWQPQAMSEAALAASKSIAESVTAALGGWGLFGVELFIKGDQVWFSEVSPRPHDTGLVTLISQDLSEFALHARAILGLPIPNIANHGPSASAVILVDGVSNATRFDNLHKALAESDTQLRLFGKPEVNGQRRMGVALARGVDVNDAKAKAIAASEAVKINL